MKNEVSVQSEIRLQASERGWRLFRNNVGVLIDKTGRPVRFGLANDSKAINLVYKSGDLIGLRPVLVTPEMVGQTIGQFVSIECKASTWKPCPTDGRDRAQSKWAELINNLGGYAIISRGEL